MTNQQTLDSKAVPEMLELAVDWWEYQADAKAAIQPDLLALMTDAAMPLSEALRYLQTKQSVELQGPHGQAPLAVGLLLVATRMHRTADFILTPQFWSEGDWEGVTDAIATLVDLPFTFQTGHPQFAIGQ